MHTLSTQELGRNPIQAFDGGTKRFPKEEFSLTAEVETVSCEMRSPKYPVDILKDYFKFPPVAAGHFLFPLIVEKYSIIDERTIISIVNIV